MRAIPLLFAAALVCVFAGCGLDEVNPSDEPITESTYTIMGRVTITRNGIPWNLEDCHYSEDLDRYDLPVIVAYAAPSGFSSLFDESAIHLGSTHDRYYPTMIWLGDGKYKWDIEIPDSVQRPCTLYFVIHTWMDDVYGSPYRITDGILVDYSTHLIDLGTINYDIVRLSGELTVTINGEAVNNIYDGDNFETARMYIKLPDGSYVCEAEIQPNGEWSRNVEKPVADTPFLFRVEAYKNGGIFIKDLVTDIAYSVTDNDREFIFPEYPCIDFQALTLSGTIRALTPDGYQPWGNIWFYDEDLCIGSAEIKYLSYNGDGSAVWSLMVPAFSIPKELQLELDVQMGNDFYWTYSAIDITDTTDLRNIDLGVFTGWDGYAYGGL
jgi:hypothetical protein